MPKTLLQKARATTGRTHRWPEPTEQEIELAFAWASDEVTASQCAVALGYQRNQTYRIYPRFALAFKKHYQRNHKK